MLIAIASDIHDNIWNLDRVLADIRTRKAEALLFLGDFCAPFTLAQIAEGFGGPVHAVFGNNDGDPFLLSTVARKYAHVTLHGQLAELELDGKRVAINHYPKIAIRLAESGAYAAVFSGHDHQAMVQRVGTTLWANPGEVMGRFGAPGYGIYDTGADRFEHVSLAAR